jgi:SAM-dependent methyltransferase
VTTGPDGFDCRRCTRQYLLQSGIPDFRIFPDPYLNFAEDRERTEIVLSALDRLELHDLLEYYWSFSDVTPVALRPKFIRSALLGDLKAKATLRFIEANQLSKVGKTTRVLEIGCGTGNFLAEAAQKFDTVVGVDIAMRWLHLSRRRFMDRGLECPPLVCCCAEFLPFPDETFDLVTASATLEFVNDQSRVLKESNRVLARDGAMHINTANRYSIAADPYCYLWGVGFLPRRLQAAYVKRRSGAKYDNIKTMSLGGLMHLGRETFNGVEITLPRVEPLALKYFSLRARFQAKVYGLAARLTPAAVVLRRLGPGWNVVLRKAPSGRKLTAVAPLQGVA